MAAKAYTNGSCDTANALLQQAIFERPDREAHIALIRELHQLGDYFVMPDGTCVVIGYDATRELLVSPKFIKNDPTGNAVRGAAFANLTPEQTEELAALSEEASAPFMVVLDPPDHNRIRSLVREFFTPKNIAHYLSETVDRSIDRLIHRIDTTHPVDVYADFGATFAPEIVAELLGLPDKDRVYIHDLTSTLMRGVDPGASFELRKNSTLASNLQRDYIRKLIALRKANPGSNAVDSLISLEGPDLDEEELISLFQVLYLGGYETTAHMIGNGLVALLQNPKQMALLLEDIDRWIGPAVAEIIRYDGPIALSQVYADYETKFAGEDVDPGAKYLGLLTFANRDPEAFENPNTFDITRKQTNPLSFGGGIHICLGMHLARLELEKVFAKLVSRFPRMQLVEKHPARLDAFHQQTYAKVEVIFEP